MNVLQVFSTSTGTVRVPADDEESARRVLARHAWDGLPPAWPHVEEIVRVPLDLPHPFLGFKVACS